MIKITTKKNIVTRIKKILGVKERKRKERIIVSITGAPSPIEIPSEFRRGGVWCQFKNDTLEIYVPASKEPLHTLAIGDSVDEHTFKIIMEKVKIVSQRLDNIQMNRTKQNKPYSGNEVIEV